MAEEEKPKKEKEEEGEKKPAGAGGLKAMLVPIVSSAVTAALVGTILMVFLAPKPAPVVEEEGEKKTETGHGGGHEGKEGAGEEGSGHDGNGSAYKEVVHTGIYFQYDDPFQVSIFDEEKIHYLRVKVSLELASDEVKHEVEVKDPQIKDSLLFVLSDFTLRELLDNQAKLLVKEVVLKTLNKVVGKDKVIDVYFTEFIVQ